jgi:hypothetical protein
VSAVSFGNNTLRHPTSTSLQSITDEIELMLYFYEYVGTKTNTIRLHYR